MRARHAWLACVALSHVVGCASAEGGGGDGGADSGTATPDAPEDDIDAAEGVDAALPIDAASCATSPCDLLEQCGCSGNQACDIDFSDLDGTACRDVTVMGDENDTCTGISQCAAGSVCVGDGTSNSCERYCDADADCGAPRGQCVIQLVDDTSQPIPGAVVCSSNCDPAVASNASCPAGWTCDLFNATFGGADRSIVDCRAAGTRQLDQTCSATMLCAAGLTCTNTGTSSICLKICTRPAGTECAAVPGSTCTSFDPAFTVGGAEYGVCF